MLPTPVFLGFPGGSDGKNPPAIFNVGDLGLIPGLGRSPREDTYLFYTEFHGLYSPWGSKESDMTE